MHRFIQTARIVFAITGIFIFFTGIAYAAAPDTPTNLTPVDGSGSQSKTPTLTSSDFNDSDLDTHDASQWQISLTADSFASTVWDSGEDSINLTSVVVGITLSNDTKYYWHVRYKDSNGDWSSYSDPTVFTPAKTQLSAIGSHEFKSSEVAILAVMVKDGNGNPVLSGSGATATIDVFNPSQSHIVTEDAMTYLSGSLGVFYYGYTTPATTGVYAFVTNVTYNDQTSYSASTFHVSSTLNTVNTIKTTTDTINTNLDTVSGTVDTIGTNLNTVGTTVDTISTNLDTVSGTVDTVSTNLDTVSNNVDTISTNVDTLLDNVATINDTVDDIKSVVTTIDVHVDDSADTTDETLVRVKDIGDTTDATLRRVKDIQSDLSSIKTKLRSIDSDTAAIKDAVDSLATKASNDDATLLASLNTQLGFSGKSGSVQTMLTDTTTRLQGILFQLGIHAAEIDKIVSLETAGGEDIHSIVNQLSTLRAVAGTAQTIISGKSQPSTSAWYTFGSIIEHFMVINPTNTVQTVPVKGYLPAEITRRDILDLGGMERSYDTEKKQIVVTAEALLQPGETRIYSVEMRDIFSVDSKDLVTSIQQAERIMGELKQSDVSGIRAESLLNTIKTRIDAIEQSQADTTRTAVEKMDTFRSNQKAWAKVQEDLDSLRSLRSGQTNARIPLAPFVWIVSGIALLIIVRMIKAKWVTRSYVQSDREQVQWHDFLKGYRRS